jgi:hypothetical protein
LVVLNNNLIQTLEKLKEVAGALLGAYTLCITVEGNVVAVRIVDADDKPAEQKAIDDMKTKNAVLGTQWTDLEARVLAVNEAGTAAKMEFTMKKGRLYGKCDPATEKDVKKAAMKGVAAFNIVQFKVRMELGRASMAEALNPKKALNTLIDSIKKECKDGFKVGYNVNLDGLMEGKIELDFNFGDMALDALPGKIKKAVDAFISDDEENPGLIKTITDIVVGLAELLPKFDELRAAIEGLPTDPGEIMEKATEAEISPMEAPKIGGKLVGNGKQFAMIPLIMKGLADSIKGVTNDLKEAVAAAQGK